MLLRNSDGATSSITPGRKASSTAASSPNGSVSPRPKAMRPASHTAVSTTRGNPENPRLPVQLGTAVSRNPAIAAAIKTKIIS